MRHDPPPPPPAAPTRLLPRLAAALRVRHYSPRTEEAYAGRVRRFVRFHGLRHPAELGEAEVARFLTHLAVVDRVAPSTQNQALAALLFLYRHVLGAPLALPEDAVRARARARLPTMLYTHVLDGTGRGRLGVRSPADRGREG